MRTNSPFAWRLATRGTTDGCPHRPSACTGVGDTVTGSSGGGATLVAVPPRPRGDPVAIASVGLFGVAAVADLASLGMPTSTISRRVQAGHARPLLPGVGKEGPDEPTADQRAAAALLYGGRGSVLSGGEALRRHGLADPRPDARILVLVDAGRQRTSSAFVVIERTGRLPRPVSMDGLPVAP